MRAAAVERWDREKPFSPPIQLPGPPGERMPVELFMRTWRLMANHSLWFLRHHIPRSRHIR